MKNERYLLKSIINFSEKIVKICIVFIGFVFLTGFYEEKNIYIELEELTVELGSQLPKDKLDYINLYLYNSKFYLEDNVPKNDMLETTKIGTYNYYIVYRDEERKYSRLTDKKSTISVIDTIKPVIEEKNKSKKFEYGSNIKVDDIATCYDLSKCNLSFKNMIDTNKEGDQTVTVVAIDEGNNVSEKEIVITIKEKPRYYGYPASMIAMNNYNNALNSKLSEADKNALRYRIVEFAKQFVGNPYVYGGNSLTNGTDCSGFTQLVYANFGYRLPRTAANHAYIGKAVNYGQLLPGDIITYYYGNKVGHVAIYIGNGKLVHAGTPQTGIVIVPVFSGNRGYQRIIF